VLSVNYQILSQIESAQPFLTDTTLISVVENQIKYEGYIKRQLEEIEKYSCTCAYIKQW
jgi:tRNA uridine 5-carboxymethylaminomethyl modification enzyme